MPLSSSPSKFDTLRPWDGSQARAFEELSYQLLKSNVPPGLRAIRTGNPDGGVEWYATLADGTEWGWQAKHVHGIDPLLTAMKASVKRVVQDRPKLVKLTFVISWNLATSTRGGERLSQRQKYEDRVASWNSSVTGAAGIEFDLIQESDLLARLAQPEHRGREWFWWGSPVFGAEWLARRHSEQVDAAGEKYRPDLQVDLPIENDLMALGAAQSVLAELETLRREVTRAGRKMQLAPTGPNDLVKLHQGAIRAAENLVQACSEVIFQAGSYPAALSPLKMALSQFSSAINDAQRHELGLDRGWKQLEQSDPDNSTLKPPTEARGYSVRQLQKAVSELDTWLKSSVGRALQERMYFLEGPAGSGKTHLFLDAVRRALDDGRPAAVLFGARFGRGDLWTSICDQLGLEPLGADFLLGAMDAAGEAAALEGRRFLLLIDALNETVPPDFWLSQLPALRAAVARWPHVSLAVSCRDTYLSVVDEGNEHSKYVRRSHPGFADREIEATQKYFNHYRLETPRIPLLLPEFRLPLFLRMYCEGLQDSGNKGPAEGHEGRVKIFDRYLDKKLQRVARRLRQGASTAYEVDREKLRATKIVDALLDEFAANGREGVGAERAEELVIAATEWPPDEAAKALGALQSEGVLTREQLYLGNGSVQDGFRIVFQAFADYLILRRRFSAVPEPMSSTDIRRWLLEDCSWGILEAAAVSLPELYRVELPDFLGISGGVIKRPEGEDEDDRRRVFRAKEVFRSIHNTLPYRDAKAVTTRTVEILNQSIGLVSSVDLFRTMFLVAPQPANLLNADNLHRILLRFPMPRRDALFGFATYQEIFNESSPIATLARWAARGPYPDYDPKVIELSCVPLAWLLSSPNRFMRDWVTKAMVQLLRGHLDVAHRLLNRFWEVDDPYVVQRVMTICYGALMRSDPADYKDAKKLVERIRKLVFTQPVRADELMLDAARGSVEWGVMHKLLPQNALTDIERPYGLAAPSTPPTKETLEKKYGFKDKQPDDNSYVTIYSSLMGMGDFAHYVVEPGVHNFSRYRYGEEFPERESRSEPRFIKSRWKVFEKTLSVAQREELVKSAEEAEASGPLEPTSSPWLGTCSSLSKEQHELLRAVWHHPTRGRWRRDEYPADRAQRWIFRRALALGWTPKLFGYEDRLISYGQGGREEHKAERWGKKYQWMAYHELLARIADNFQPNRHWGEDSEPYEGLHQIIGDREIDPSLPPIEYRAFAENAGRGSSTWRQAPVRVADWPPGKLDFKHYGGSIDLFLADTASEPALDCISIVTDDQGERWVLLEAFLSQSDPSEDESWLGLQQPFSLYSWLAPRVQAPGLLPHLLTLQKSHEWDLGDDQGHIDCCYAGEIGWTPHSCYHRHADLKTIGAADQKWQLVRTVETYTWEGSLLDCSIGESVSASMPSTFIQARARLKQEEHGPSWRDTAGTVVFTNYREESVNRCKALLVRGSWLRTFLREHDLELLVTSWFARELNKSDHRHPRRSVKVYSAARIDADLNITVADQVRKHR